MAKAKYVLKVGPQRENLSLLMDQEQYRPQQVVNVKSNAIIAFLIFLSSLIIYWITQNRSVTFWDVGEYIASSSILGVPHPPGNPFYIILGRFFTIIGLNTPHALVINSMSGLMAALAVMFTYLFTVKLVSMMDENKYLIYTAGIIAALYTAFSFTFWNNAVEASVYPGRDMIINMCIWLTLVWVEKSRSFSHQNILLLIIYVFFLGFGIHQTALQIIPAVLLIVIYPLLISAAKTSTFWIRGVVYLVFGMVLYFTFIEVGKAYHIPDMAKIVTGVFFCLVTWFHLKGYVPLKAWLLALLFIGLALSPHLYLFVRSELRPFINEGHPHNLELFSDYVLRRQYGVVSFLMRRATFYYQMTHHFLRYFSWQFFHVETIAEWLKLPTFFVAQAIRMLVLFLGFGGIYYQAKKNRHSFIYLLAFFLMASVAMVFVMNLSDGEVRDRDYFFNSAYNLWAVWMGIGSIWLISWLRKKKKALAPLMLLLVLSLPIINFASQYFIHNRSREFIALDYGLNFLNSLEENAIVFTNGDNDTFPLWYAQAVYDPNAIEHVHPAKDVYPSATTKEFIEAAVNGKRNELSGIRPDVTVANLSLLNTPWYIRHLRDIEGVRFNIPDNQIENIRPLRVDRRRELHLRGSNNEVSAVIPIPANKVLLIKDQSAIQIIRDNFGKRPIYFAVTVADEIVFKDYLRNEGMVNRLVPNKDPNQIDIDRLKLNVEEIYSYRSIFDDNVHKDENMQKLVTNYGAAYMRISQHYHIKGDLAEAARYMEQAISFIRERERFYPAMIQLYMDAEDYDKALSFINRTIENEPLNLTLYIQAAYMNLEKGLVDPAFDLFEQAIDAGIKSGELISYVFLTAKEYEAIDQGIRVLEKLRQQDEFDVVDEYIASLREIRVE